MAISISKYVDITSGVGGGAVVRQRDLIGRLFTTSTRVPVDTIVTIDSADDAVSYFGAGSVEALRAAFYFSFVSKSISTPQRMSFARWANVATAPEIYGMRTTTTLTQWQAITAGTLTITMGANTNALTGLNFSGAATLAAVATIVQTALRASVGPSFATATVSYDAPSQTFHLTGSGTGAAPVAITASGANDIADELGWSLVGAILSPGAAVATLTAMLAANASADNNFGSFAFVPVLTDVQRIEVATWNAARNVEFMYCVPALASEAVALSAALIGFAGTAVTLTDGSAGQYDEMVPMVVLAATDYDRRNSAQNYMFQQFPSLTAKVTSDLNYEAYNGMRVNYYGVTQTAGQLIAFYQRGLLMGGTTSPLDMNVYANEMWLKDAAAAAIMSLLLSVPRVPANPEGRAQVLAILQDAIDRALFNGVISVGKTLSPVQKLYITQQSGDPDAWHQVQNVGYWLDCTIEPYTTTGGLTEYQAVYTLIYGKDDAIRRVEGTHVLI